MFTVSQCCLLLELERNKKMDQVSHPHSLYLNRILRKIASGEGCWQMNCEDYSDFFLQKYLDDSFRSEFMKVVFEKDPLTEDEKKGILNSIYLDCLLKEEPEFLAVVCLLLAAGADVNSRSHSHHTKISALHFLSMGKRKRTCK